MVWEIKNIHTHNKERTQPCSCINIYIHETFRALLAKTLRRKEENITATNCNPRWRLELVFCGEWKGWKLYKKSKQFYWKSKFFWNCNFHSGLKKRFMGRNNQGSIILFTYMLYFFRTSIRKIIDNYLSTDSLKNKIIHNDFIKMHTDYVITEWYVHVPWFYSMALLVPVLKFVTSHETPCVLHILALFPAFRY